MATDDLEEQWNQYEAGARPQGPVPPMPSGMDPNATRPDRLIGRTLLGDDPVNAKARLEMLLSAAGGTGAALLAPMAGVPAGLATGAAAVLGAAAGGAVSSGVTGESALGAAASGAIGEGVGQGLFKLAKPALHVVSSILGKTPGLRRLVGPSLKVEPGAADAEAQLLSRGGTLTAGQATSATFTDFFENIADSSLLGGPIIKATKANAQRIANEDIATEAARFAAIPNRAVRGQLVQETLDGITDAFGARMRVGFQGLDQDLVAAGQASDRVVDIRPLLLQAQEVLGKVQLPSQSSKVMGLLQDVLMDPASKVARAQGKRVPLRPRQEFISFGEAQSLRSELLALTSTIDDPMVSKTVGATKGLRATLDTAIDDAGGRLPPGFVDKYRVLNGEWKAGHETYNNDFIKQVVKLEDPELLFDVAVKDGMPTRITKLREALQDAPEFPKVWNEIQGQWIRGLLEKSHNAIPGTNRTVLSGAELSRNIERFGEAQGALFPGEGLGHLKKLAETLDLTQRSAGTNRAGGMFIQLAQAGAFIQVATGLAGSLGVSEDTQDTIDSTSWGIMLGPPALAIAFRDPRFVRYLTLGLQEPVGSKTLLRLTGQLFTRAAELGIADHSAILPDPNPPATAANNMVDLVNDRVVGKMGEMARDAQANLGAAQRDLRESTFPPPGGVDKLREMIRQRGGQ